VLAPELVEQLVRGDHAAGIERQQAQQRALLLAAEYEWPSVVDDFERTENPELKHVFFVSLVASK
jgi:hypothetical protein